MFGILDNIGPLGQLMPKLYVGMSFAEPGSGDEVVIPFIESVPEEQREAIKGFVNNSGATTESLKDFDTFDKFLVGYKPPAPVAPAAAPAAKLTSWKAGLGEDLSKSPTLEKFEDTPEGLINAVKSHVNLEKLLGHEKVPIPKGPDDVEGQALFNKAMGVPETAEEYNLEDSIVPEGMKEYTFDKATFSKILRENNVTKAQATNLWKQYTELTSGVYTTYMKNFNAELAKTVNALKAQWGDAYAANVELGDMVISKFADDQNMGDFLTAALSKDPRGIKFLAKIGSQFAENKVGDFKYSKFSVSPDEAKVEIDKISNDPNHAYRSEKASEAEHNAAVEYVNKLQAIVNKGNQG